MKDKFLFLIKQSLKKKIKSKWFIIVNILLCIGIILLVNIDSVISFFGGDFNKEKNIIVVSEIKDVDTYSLFKSNLDNYSKLIDDATKYKIENSNENIKKIKNSLKEEDILINILDDSDFMKADVISLEKIDTAFYQILLTSLNETKKSIGIYKSGIDTSKYTKISSNIKINREVINEGKNTSENMDLIMGTVFPILILPFFMLSIILIQMIGAEVNDEKTTRGMEIIISNVSPKVHFASKIISGNLFVIIQGLILIVAFIIGIIIRGGFDLNSVTKAISLMDINMIIDTLKQTGFMDKLYFIIPLTLLLMILTFIAYSLIAGILASMTTNIEDYQQIQTTLAIISVVGYYLAMMSPMFSGAIFIKVASYLPFIGGVLSPALLMMGQINVYDIVISIVVLILTNILLIKYGMRIYKVGILNYSARNIWKKMGSALVKK